MITAGTGTRTRGAPQSGRVWDQGSHGEHIQSQDWEQEQDQAQEGHCTQTKNGWGPGPLGETFCAGRDWHCCCGVVHQLSLHVLLCRTTSPSCCVTPAPRDTSQPHLPQHPEPPRAPHIPHPAPLACPTKRTSRNIHPMLCTALLNNVKYL